MTTTITRSEAISQAIKLLEEEHNEFVGISEKIPAVLVSLRAENVTEEVTDLLEKLAKWYYDMYSDSSSAAHLIASGMYEYDAKHEEEVMAPRYAERSSAYHEVLDAISTT